MTLSQWKAEFILALQQKKLWVAPAAARYISNPKLAGTKKKYIIGVKAFLLGHDLPEELAKFTEAAEDAPKVAAKKDTKSAKAKKDK